MQPEVKRMATATDEITTKAKHNFEDAASRGRALATQANGEFAEFTSNFILFSPERSGT
jgi:hypothetical protein